MPNPTLKPFRRLLAPTLADLFFGALLAALFGRADNWRALLADGDTGWHIRTGEWILAARRVPWSDPYSFSRPGEPWFAWEWGSDLIFALVHARGGLAAVAGLAAAVLCLAALVVFCRIVREGAGLWVAAAVTLAAVSASSVHFLARPHIFSLLLFPVCLWLLAEDRRRHSPRVWALVPLAALWANLHGGFVAWLAVLALAAATAAAEGGGPWRRYSLLAGASTAATLANPYGWSLHWHIARYLASPWIQASVTEFQSPRFRSENMLLFAGLLLAGVALVSAWWARGRWFDGALVLVWAFAALRSARNIPLYALAAAPLVAEAAADLWRRRAARLEPRAALSILWNLGLEMAPAAARPGPWLVIAGAALLWLVAPRGGLADFPAERFPVAAVARHAGTLAPAGARPRILTSDQWADYLIYRLYPRQRVFFDGRSDFYGAEVGADYQALYSATGGWSEALDRYGFEIALLPRDWPLAAVLERDPAWRLVDRDPGGTLLVRTGAKAPAQREGGAGRWMR